LIPSLNMYIATTVIVATFENPANAVVVSTFVQG
jgi:hypothetical protein